MEATFFDDLAFYLKRICFENMAFTKELFFFTEQNENKNL